MVSSSILSGEMYTSFSQILACEGQGRSDKALVDRKATGVSVTARDPIVRVLGIGIYL